MNNTKTMEVINEIKKLWIERPGLSFSQLVSLVYSNIKDISCVSNDITLQLIQELKKTTKTDIISQNEITDLLSDLNNFSFSTHHSANEYFSRNKNDILSQSEIDDIRKKYSCKKLSQYPNATVLIIDDAAFMRMMLKDMFNRNGYKVIGEAADGEEGLEKFAELEPDITVVDITMPILDGISVIKRITGSPTYILVCSAQGTYDIVKECFDAGIDDFIVKPFQADRLLQIK